MPRPRRIRQNFLTVAQLKKNISTLKKGLCKSHSKMKRQQLTNYYEQLLSGVVPGPPAPAPIAVPVPAPISVPGPAPISPAISEPEPIIIEIGDTRKRGITLEPLQRAPTDTYYIKKNTTEQPKFSRREKQKPPSKKAPVRPVAFLEANLKTELDKLLDKTILRVAYYYASTNVWNYKQNMVAFTNKLIKGIKKKYASLKTDEKDKIIQSKLGAIKSYSKSAALNDKFKTSKVAFDKIIAFLDKRYPV